MEKNWFVLYTKPRKEKLVIKQLVNNKIVFFYPKIKNRKGKKERLFPRYIFINVDSTTIKEPMIKWMPGVVNIVNFDGQNAIVPDHIIHLMKQRIAEIQLSENKFLDSLQKGDEIIISDGIFNGYRGIFDLKITGKERVRVFLKLLSDQSTQIELRPDQIRLAE